MSAAFNKPVIEPHFKPSDLETPESFCLKGEEIPADEHLFLGVLLEFLKEKDNWDQVIKFDDIAYANKNKEYSTCCRKYSKLYSLQVTICLIIFRIELP